ncbi:MAG: tetratricopeptide repeat protein, partial [Spirochaetota bacterium]
ALFCAAFLDPFADRVGEGNSRYNDGKYQEAGRAYDEAQKYLPSRKDEPDLAFNKGDARFKCGDYDGAIDFYKQAVDSENKDVQKKALFNIGNAYEKKGDKVSAADAYLSALRIDPKYDRAKKNLENLYRKDKEDKDKKNEKGKDQQKDDKGSGKDKNQQEQKAKSRPVSSDQMKALMQMMKDKPVRRQKKEEKGQSMFGGGNEKPW